VLSPVLTLVLSPVLRTVLSPVFFFYQVTHCRYLGKVVFIILIGESVQTRWKVKSSNTRDTTTSEWSRLFLNECFIASSRLREDIGRR